MLDFLTLKPEAFGLDISDSSLKVIKLEKKAGDLSLVSYGEGPISTGVIRKGEIRKEKELAKAVQNAISKVKGKKINSKYIIVSLPEEKAFLQVIQMPLLAEEDLKSAVIYEAENYIPLPIEQVYLDSWVIPSDKDNLDHQDVLIAALPRAIVDPYLSALKLAGLQPLAFEIESLAIARALVKKEEVKQPVLLVDLGASRTSFNVFSGRSLRLTLSIPVSSQGLTEAIEKTTGVSLAQAEKLKLKHGIKEKEGKEGAKVFEALIPSLTDMSEQTKRCIDYYLSHSSSEHLPANSKKIEKIILSGGGANLKGLPEFLTDRLKIPVEIGNPWINILKKGKKEGNGLSFEKSLSYTTALGLALRGVDA